MGVAYLPPVRKAFEELADSNGGGFSADRNGCKSPFTRRFRWRRYGLRPNFPHSVSPTRRSMCVCPRDLTMPCSTKPPTWKFATVRVIGMATTECLLKPEYSRCLQSDAVADRTAERR